MYGIRRVFEQNRENPGIFPIMRFCMKKYTLEPLQHNYRQIIILPSAVSFPYARKICKQAADYKRGEKAVD
jgi:hypothetical protein